MKKALSLLMVFIFSAAAVFATEPKPETTAVEQTKAKEKDVIVMCHSEEHDVTNLDTRLSENLMTWRNIALSEFTGCKVHIAHVSTKESMEYIYSILNSVL